MQAATTCCFGQAPGQAKNAETPAVPRTEPQCGAHLARKMLSTRIKGQNQNFRHVWQIFRKWQSKAKHPKFTGLPHLTIRSPLGRAHPANGCGWKSWVLSCP